jgi:ATP-dependent 26S proteasome regulatory subunit
MCASTVCLCVCLVQAVFSVARKSQPSVVFFDEIDALLSARKVKKKKGTPLKCEEEEVT